MDNSWNNQHFQQGQKAPPIKFFDPSQFQTPAANPATLKQNQNASAQGNVAASNSFQPPHEQQQQQQQQPNPAQAWGGAPANAAASGGGGAPDAHSSWSNWGSWDWNAENNNLANNDQQPDQQHQQQQQQHYQQQQHIQQQQAQPYQAVSSQPQSVPPHHYQQEQQPHPSQMAAANDPAHNMYNAHQYNSWDPSGQYAEPNQAFAGNQDMQYSQPHNMAYYGDHNAYGQNQYAGAANVASQEQPQHQQQLYPDNSQPPGESTDHQQQEPATNQQANSASLDQGQSQVQYDEPSVPQPYNPASFNTSEGWYGHAQQPHYHQQEGTVQGNAEGGSGGNTGNESLDDGQSNEPSLVANLNSIPSTSSQGMLPVVAEPTLNEYCDNDDDGGTVAGFFGRGDDDGDVSSDAQRSNKLNSHFTPGPESADHGQLLNVRNSIARENSEISNASMSTFNMSVDDEGKEHLHDLQALVQRMENVDIANRQAAAENQYQGEAAAVAAENVALEHHQQQPYGDYSGFGNEAPKHYPPPPPTLALQTNPERPSSPDGGIPASSESGGSGGSGGSSGLTDWEIVPSQSQMTHSRNSSLDNGINVFSDKPDGSVTEPQRESQDGGMDDNLHHNQSSQSFNEGVVNFPHTLSQAKPTGKVENVPSSHEQLPPAVENPPLASSSATLPPAFVASNATAPSSNLSQLPPPASEGMSFQPSRSPHSDFPPSSTAPYVNPLMSNAAMPPPPPQDKSIRTNSNPNSAEAHKAKSIAQQLSTRPKMASEDGERPANRKEPDQRSTGADPKFRKPRDLPKKESEERVSLSSQRRHQSAFQPVHKPRQTTASPALWETDSTSSSNILLAPAMPLIIPALNPYSTSAAEVGTTNTPAMTANMSKSSSSSAISDKSRGASKELEDQTPRSRYGERKGDRDRVRDERPKEKEREKEDANRSLDSLDELDSSIPEYRSARDDKGYKSDRPSSRYQYERPSSRADRPGSRTDRPSSHAEGYRDDPYRRTRGYYADSYYDEQYDRPRSRHEEAKNTSRPSSRTAQQQQEADRPRSRGGEYDRDRDYAANRDRQRGYNYDAYGRSGDYYDERDRYYRYYRDREARYSRGYYEEYYGTKNAEQYLQQHQQQEQRAGGRSHQRTDGHASRSQSASTGRSQSSSRSQSANRSQSRGNTPGLEHSGDYYSRDARPDSRQDYARDYYARGHHGGSYDYSGYYDGYGNYPYGYGYPGYEDLYNQGVVEQTPARMTPPKYSYAHIRASFGPKGQLVKVLPNSPADGQPALVELHEVQTVLEACQEADDLKQFPGPLTREGTHKKDVLLFCQRKARECMEDVDTVDRESAQLVWKLLELLIKQNGSVVGTDLSDLLLDGHEPGISQYNVTNRRYSFHSNDGLEPAIEGSLEGDGSSRNSPAAVRTSMDRTLITPSRQREDSIARFRHLLLYGRKKDAIECAMKYNLWGHALFLASKMDTRTHASVMIRFANSAMRMNDPLQTLYQLMSGRQPASVTCVDDERWGDWRPHLAMILSNQTSRQDLDRKSITTLGDTLAAKGCLFASHFCYLMAQVPFGTYDKKTSKIVLIGSNHLLALMEFASNEAIECTEVYEYAQTLNNPVFCLPHLQLFKYLYACRLVDYGMASEALMYCEVISSSVCRYPTYFQPSFVHLVFELASKLKYSDPQRQNNHVDDQQDPVWMQQLLGLLAQYADGSIQPVVGTITQADMQQVASNTITTTAANGSGSDGAAAMYQPAIMDASGVPGMAAATAVGGGEATVHGSGSTGFDVQQTNQHQHQQYPSQQQGYGDYTGQGQGQYYPDASGVDQQQQQQQYPGYDQTDASQQQQQQPQYPDGYQGYEQQQQQQQQEYSQWQQQQYAGYHYTQGYGEVDSLQQQQQQHLQQHLQHQQAQQLQQQQQQQADSLTSSSNSSVSTTVLPPSLCPRPSVDYGSAGVEDTGHQTDLTSSYASSDFSAAGLGQSGGSSMMAGGLPPRASVSTNETEDDDEDDDGEGDDAEGIGGGMTGFDYFGNPGGQRVVVPPHRYRTPSESSSTGTARRRRTMSGSSTGSVKASPHKSPPQSTAHPPPKGPSTQLGSEGDMKGAGGQSGGGWFGGLFSKFGRTKGKNEMILPDDKDPAILWDSQKKKWVNADGTEEETVTAAPPPKDTDLMGGSSSGAGGPPTPSSIPGGGMPPPPASGPPGANRFSLKAKGTRSNQYVDLNNPKPVAVPQGLFNVGPTPTSNSSAIPQVFLPGSTPGTASSQTSNNNNNSEKEAAGNSLLNVPASSTSNDMTSDTTTSTNQQQAAPTATAPTSQPLLPPSNPAMPMLFNPATLNTTVGTTAASTGSGTARPGMKYGQRRAYPKK